MMIQADNVDEDSAKARVDGLLDDSHGGTPIRQGKNGKREPTKQSQLAQV